jgi:hypothetical protein
MISSVARNTNALTKDKFRVQGIPLESEVSDADLEAKVCYF